MDMKSIFPDISENPGVIKKAQLLPMSVSMIIIIFQNSTSSLKYK